MSKQRQSKKRHPDLVYGRFLHNIIVVMEEEWALRAAAEVKMMRSARTLGEAILMEGCLTILIPPYREEMPCPGDAEPHEAAEVWASFFNRYPLDKPWDFREVYLGLDDVQHLPWPPSSTAEAIPSSWEIGEWCDPVLDDEYLIISPDEETKLVGLAHRDRVRLRRDDTLINYIAAETDEEPALIPPTREPGDYDILIEDHEPDEDGARRLDFTEEERRLGDALIGGQALPHELAEMSGLGYI